MSDNARTLKQNNTIASIIGANYVKGSGLEGPFMTKSGKLCTTKNEKVNILDPDKICIFHMKTGRVK